MYRRDASPDRSLLISAFAGQIFALDRATGAIRWEVNIGDYSAVELFLAEGVVVVATLKHLAFLDYATGALHRTVELAAHAGRSTMLVDGAHIYVGGSGAVACYTLRGDCVWSQPFKGKGIGDVALGLPGNVRQADANT